LSQVTDVSLSQVTDVSLSQVTDVLLQVLSIYCPEAVGVLL